MAPNNSPRVSIGLPVYNGEGFIREALDSLLSQTCEDFEVIISDNASSDGTEMICLDYAQKEPRIRYVRHLENKGPGANFQFVLDQAKGEYFMWAAHDDIWGSDFLSAGIEALAANDNAVAAFGRVEYVDQDNNVFLIDSPPYGLCNNIYLSTATYLCTNIPDHLIYGLYRRDFLLHCGWRTGISSPDKLIIFNAVVAGGFIDAPNMELRIRYRAKTKSELQRLGFNLSRWHGLYMSYLMAAIVWTHFPIHQSINLFIMLIKYRTPITNRIFGGELKEHPGRTWIEQGTHRVAGGLIA